MVTDNKCDNKDCEAEYPGHQMYCPHCYWRGKFQNVTKAQEVEEVAALMERYTQALNQAAGDAERKRKIKSFEERCDNSNAVICCKASEIIAIGNGYRYCYRSWDEKLAMALRDPRGPVDWRVWRPIVDVLLLGSHNNIWHLYYGSFSLNDFGVANYGECHVVLREGRIAHRASAFDSNSVVHFIKKKQALFSPVDKGFRSDWICRSKLCVAKLASKIHAETPDDDFAGILLSGATSIWDDDFVELHVLMPLTFLCFKTITIPRSALPHEPDALRVFREFCHEHKIKLRELE